jgi:hypothetical protein
VGDDDRLGQLGRARGEHELGDAVTGDGGVCCIHLGCGGRVQQRVEGHRKVAFNAACAQHHVHIGWDGALDGAGKAAAHTGKHQARGQCVYHMAKLVEILAQC